MIVSKKKENKTNVNNENSGKNHFFSFVISFTFFTYQFLHAKNDKGRNRILFTFRTLIFFIRFWNRIKTK